MSKEKMLEEIITEIASEFNKLAGYLMSFDQPPSIEEMEVACQSTMRAASSRVMELIVSAGDRGYGGTSILCSCGKPARFVGYRKKVVQTLVGDITLRRAYYHCKSCGEGIYPLDETLGISRRQMSKTLERCVCRLAAVESFEDCVEDIRELTGACISAKTAQVSSEAVGESMLIAMEKEAKDAVSGDIEIESSEHPEVLCIAMDGKMIPQTGGQHRELKVAAVYDLLAPEQDRTNREPGRTTYIGQFAEPDIFGEAVWVEAVRRGGETAREVAVVGDGAHWIWNQAENHWPEAVQIIDFWHVSEHMWELGNLLYGQGTKKTQRFVGYKLDQIRDGKVKMVIRALCKIKTADPEKRERLRQTIGYLDANKHRMKYPKYRQKGYHIGSGVVESACKQFGARLDQAGMRWSKRGAGAIAALRSTKLSGRWDQYWQPARMPLLA